MGTTLTAVKEGTKVMRPRNDTKTEAETVISTVKTIPLCMIRVLQNLTLLFCMKVWLYKTTIKHLIISVAIGPCLDIEACVLALLYLHIKLVW